jgi:hypothetical protein
VTGTRVELVLWPAVSHDVTHEEIRRPVAVVVEAPHDFLAEAAVARRPLDGGVASRPAADLELEAIVPAAGEVVVPGDEEGSIAGAPATVGGSRCAGGWQGGTRTVERSSGQHLGTAVSVEVGDLHRGAKVELVGIRGRRHLGDVPRQGRRPEVLEVDGLGGGQMSSTADHVDGAAVGLTEFGGLVRAHHDVRNPVSGDVTRAHPDAQAELLSRADDGRHAEAPRRRPQVCIDESGSKSPKTRTPRDDGERSGARPLRVRRVVLPGDEEVGELVVGDLVHPDLAARMLLGLVADDRQDVGIRDAGVEGSVDLAIAKDQVHLARIATAQWGGVEGREGEICLLVSVHVVAARHGHATGAGSSVPVRAQEGVRGRCRRQIDDERVRGERQARP